VKPKLITILLIVFYLISCKTNRDKEFRKSICGEWIFARVGCDNDKRNEEKKRGQEQVVLPPPIFENSNSRTGYIFYINNSCEDKRGYFKLIKSKSREERETLFLGTDTKYKVENDSLKIFDLADSIWKGIKIRSITSDTLTLEIKDTIFFKYAKPHYKIDKAQTFDMILVSTSACYGACPISSTCLDKNGNLIFYGQSFTSKEGLFESKIDKVLYKRIEQNFKKANIDTLYDRYSVNWSDAQTVTVTFIKDNKIYKTISDYGHKAPREFYWAYTSVNLLYQKLNLKPFATKGLIEFPRSYTYFENRGQICCLEKSESFYLFTEICKSKEVQINFEKKYVIEYRDTENKKKKILTDGRYYQLEQKNKTIIIDLGYNFLTRNNLLKKFRTKTVND